MRCVSLYVLERERDAVSTIKFVSCIKWLQLEHLFVTLPIFLFISWLIKASIGWPMIPSLCVGIKKSLQMCGLASNYISRKPSYVGWEGGK